MSKETRNNAPVSAEPVAEVVREALESAKNGLIWYRENFPEAESGADDEAEALIELALACLAAPVAAQAQPAGNAELGDVLQGMFRKLDGVDHNQPGYHHASGWNAALRQVMDVLRAQTFSAQAQPDLIRFDYVNADGQPDSKMITHDEMRERYAVCVRHAYAPRAQQPVSGADGLPIERVLIDGTAYELPSAVAAELLRLHLEILGAEQELAALAQQDSDKTDSEIDRAFDAVRKKLVALPRYSFLEYGSGGVRCVKGTTGAWIPFDKAHALFDPVSVDAARKEQA